MHDDSRSDSPELSPVIAVDTEVTVLFDDKLYTGHVKSCQCDKHGRRAYRVDFEDGETHDDIRESEMHVAPDLMDVARVIEPSDDQLLRYIQRTPDPHLPRPQDKDLFLPSGAAYNCGGNLVFPNCTHAHRELRGDGLRMPYFNMQPGAVASFAGSDTCHATCEHHGSSPNDNPLEDCKAHISFAVQTPAPTLGLRARSVERRQLHSELLRAGARDAMEDWGDAVWLPVWSFVDATPPAARLSYCEELMEPLPWSRIVLYDADVGHTKPLVFYDLCGGLPSRTAAAARKHFGFLHENWRFGLNRQHSIYDVGPSGCLGIDSQGTQRMEMLGVRSSGRNAHRPPERIRKNEY
jgi:hypothetical protein